MRELHVVAVSEDGRHVVLAATKGASKGSYRVRLDARLVAAVRGELPGSEPAVELTPKDIQARLRAGEPADQIARSAGVPVTRVERFAGPVAAEMARTVAAAQEAYVVRGRRGPSSVPLGKAVAATVGDAATWTARREGDGRWRVAVAWQARGRAREAAWLYDGKDLTPADPASAALGHVEDAPVRRPARPAAAAIPSAPGRRAAASRSRAAEPAPATAKKAPKKAPKQKAANSNAATTTAPKRVAAPAAKHAPAKAPAAEPATSKKAPAKPATSKRAPAKPAASKKAPAKRAAVKAAPASARPRLRVVQAEPAEQRPAAEERDGVRTRASVPAWADVLLGTTPGGER